MSDVVLVAVITAIGGVLVAFVGRSNAHSKRAATAATESAGHARAARWQVENHHSTNLREEGDQRHGENVVNFGRVLDAVQEVRRDVGGLRSEVRAVRTDVGTLYRRTDTNRERLDALQTQENHPCPVTPPPSAPTPASGPSGPSPKDSPWT